MKKHSTKISNAEFKLTANELLFIPKQYDPTPLRHPNAKVSNDFIQKRNFIQKFNDKHPDEQRQFRAKQDARYSKHKVHKPNELSLLKTNADPLLCLNHLNGRCKDKDCDKHHQLRVTRLIGVCKYYLSGGCRDGDLCPFMHEEFPCRYYYLNLPHPKAMKIDECRFKHGGPLPLQLRKYFKKQIEEWVKKLTIDKPQEFDSILMNYMDKFDGKQNQLQEEYGVKDSDVQTTSNEPSSFEHILSVDQIKTLAEKKITNAAQLNRVPVDELMEYGLTMDQIYKITIDTCHEGKGTTFDQADVATDSLCHNEPASDISSSSIDTMDTTSSFEGFGNIELNVAEEELQCKKVIANDENIHLGGEDIQYGHRDNENSSDGSKDSDDEMNLFIDEDV